jgi:hypothetical protein
VTGGFDNGAEMWWDELGAILLTPSTLPEVLLIDIGEIPFTFHLGTGGQLTEAECAMARHWRAWDPPPSSRHALYVELWQRLQRLPPAVIAASMQQLRAWAGTNGTGRDDYHLLSRSQVRQLASNPLMEIGAHTVSHPVLSALPPDDQRREIECSRAELEELTGRPVAAFAYPYGQSADYTPETCDLARLAGLERSCVNFKGVVESGTDPHQVPRLFVEDWTAETFADKIRSLLLAGEA